MSHRAHSATYHGSTALLTYVTVHTAGHQLVKQPYGHLRPAAASLGRPCCHQAGVMGVEAAGVVYLGAASTPRLSRGDSHDRRRKDVNPSRSWRRPRESQVAPIDSHKIGLLFRADREAGQSEGGMVRRPREEITKTSPMVVNSRSTIETYIA